MSNRIDASVTFSYKGQTLAPSVSLDLDRFLEKEGKLPDLHLLLATENNIGLYSYEYEVLQAYPLVFANAEGLVAEFLDGEEFDVEGFIAAWKLSKVVERLEEIAGRHLGEADLNARPALRAALIEAYELGRQREGE